MCNTGKTMESHGTVLRDSLVGALKGDGPVCRISDAKAAALLQTKIFPFQGHLSEMIKDQFVSACCDLSLLCLNSASSWDT